MMGVDDKDKNRMDTSDPMDEKVIQTSLKTTYGITCSFEEIKDKEGIFIAIWWFYKSSAFQQYSSDIDIFIWIIF